ncbi:hypothetical protein ETAA8_53560 [Anatilimnocola aggregata]|uniref:Uncharacterized protein n=1 Tax=Anatilimnocola aggregata TaxID=2528021 RepID=A0A517YJ35_9BACT|nr:hypothetical protein [Anatilimnocola aggregata]QDU30237.1 hypothetical protein ETAA8_53560 [Anatilimnocola aggregata]
MQRGTWLALFVFSLAAIGCGGCTPSAPPPKPAETGHEDHGHSHSAKGPHTGKVLAIGAEEYHAEFTHDDGSGKVTVYLLDKNIKVDPAAASPDETISIEVKSKGETKKYDLAAVDRTAGDKPMASQFEVVDKELLGYLETLGGDVSATLNVKIGDKPFAQKIDFEDHGHAH